MKKDGRLVCTVHTIRNNKALLAYEKHALEKILAKKVIGIRQHFLNLEIPKTWELQKEVGFKYDASFGYRKNIGFREGKILPFKPLDENFIVIPLTIMDGPLFDQSLDLNDAWNNCKVLIDKTKMLGGLLTILWHNNRFNENEYPGQSKIYEKIIQYAKENGALITTCNEIWKLFSYDL